ncbi:hypothetical protein BpHYR1_015411 [Brachionus plicatilis]|uniref:Uncharacterized protein n=1 Tax=Brachionus plicatilis TaxID=10195 RepID=A0A3M7R2M8_BRAPC|nr:hypothetical protein BpHYR1_015411 [Brachionus plicatilis]
MKFENPFYHRKSRMPAVTGNQVTKLRVRGKLRLKLYLIESAEHLMLVFLNLSRLFLTVRIFLCENILKENSTSNKKYNFDWL